jgi:hypothetical protein
VSDELELEDAMGLASFLVSTGKVPAPAQWVDGLLDQAAADQMESFF